MNPVFCLLSLDFSHLFHFFFSLIVLPTTTSQPTPISRFSRTLNANQTLRIHHLYIFTLSLLSLIIRLLFTKAQSVRVCMAPASFYNGDSAVCVMDASGRLGSSLVKRLLERGYTVHAAIQSQNHGEEEEEDTVLFSGLSCDCSNRLKIFRSDPFDYHSIIDALKGCSGLFYAFEPPPDQPVYDEFMAEVEVRAAHNVLEACAQTDTIDKVVFISSAAAVLWRDDRKTMLADIDERHWSDITFCRKFKLWHALSKTLAEKTAWALAMDRGINLVSVNSGLLLGPDLSITHPYLKGAAEMYEDGVFVTVDLNFLIDAHICVYEDVSSYGRYLCFNNVINRNEDVVKLATMITLPSHQNQSQSYEQDMRMVQQKISNKKLNKLMVDYESGAKDECFTAV